MSWEPWDKAIDWPAWAGRVHPCGALDCGSLLPPFFPAACCGWVMLLRLGDVAAVG